MPLALPQFLVLALVCFASYASAFLVTSPPAATTSSMTAASILSSHADSAAAATPTTPAYIDVIMCRHGETCHNAEGRCQGMEDVSRLTAQGEAQALELGRALAEQGQRFDRIFISPLARARHTFDQMEKQWRALGFKGYPRCAPTFVPEIQEICLYDWQGHLRKDLEARYPDEFENWMNQPAAFRVGDHFPRAGALGSGQAGVGGDFVAIKARRESARRGAQRHQPSAVLCSFGPRGADVPPLEFPELWRSAPALGYARVARTDTGVGAGRGLHPARAWRGWRRNGEQQGSGDKALSPCPPLGLGA